MFIILVVVKNLLCSTRLSCFYELHRLILVLISVDNTSIELIILETIALITLRFPRDIGALRLASTRSALYIGSRL